MGQSDVSRVYVVKAINIGSTVDERVLAIFNEKRIGIFTFRMHLTAANVFLYQRIARVPYPDAIKIPAYIKQEFLLLIIKTMLDYVIIYLNSRRTASLY